MAASRSSLMPIESVSRPSPCWLRRLNNSRNWRRARCAQWLAERNTSSHATATVEAAACASASSDRCDARLICSSSIFTCNRPVTAEVLRALIAGRAISESVELWIHAKCTRVFVGLDQADEMPFMSRSVNRFCAVLPASFPRRQTRFGLLVLPGSRQLRSRRPLCANVDLVGSNWMEVSHVHFIAKLLLLQPNCFR